MTFALIELGMKHYLAIAAGGAIIAVLGLVLRKPLEGRGAIPGWLAGSLSGFLLGLGIAFVLMFQLGYRWSEQAPTIQVMPNIVMGGVGGGQGGGAPPPGGAPGGGGGMMGGGAPGGNRPAVTPAAAVALVKKLVMLDGGLKIELSPAQAEKITEALRGLEDAETMSNEDAEKIVDACTDVLSEEQKAVLESIDLPRRRGQAGGAAQGNPMAPAGSPMAPPGGGMGVRPVGGGAASEPPKNPFKGEEETKSLESLRAGLVKQAN